MYRNLFLAIEENRGFAKDPRLKIIHTHVKNYPSKTLSLGDTDIMMLQDVGWKILGLSIPDGDFRDETKIGYVQAISIFAIDAIEDIVRRLREMRTVLYRNVSRVRLGGRLIVRSIMGRDFDSEMDGDIYIRLLYRNIYHTRLVLSLNPFSDHKYLLIHQDGIPLFRPGYTITMHDMHVETIGEHLYITGIYNGNSIVTSTVMEDGRVQIDIRESKE